MISRDLVFQVCLNLLKVETVWIKIDYKMRSLPSEEKFHIFFTSLNDAAIITQSLEYTMWMQQSNYFQHPFVSTEVEKSIFESVGRNVWHPRLIKRFSSHVRPSLSLVIYRTAGRKHLFRRVIIQIGFKSLIKWTAEMLISEPLGFCVWISAKFAKIFF